MGEKIKTNYVDHVCIAVNDVKKAEKDYIDMFGWDVAGYGKQLYCLYCGMPIELIL